MFEDVISLTKKLLSFNTVNPEGNEQEVALFIGKLLSENGFSVNYHQLAKNRLNLIAEKGLSNLTPPLVMTGHFDTVPLGAKKWNEDPFSGKTAHSSMPELGDNAIYKTARAITKIEKFQFQAERDDLHGFPTINVGLIKWGKNLNSVPDYAEFTVDIRSTRKLTHKEILQRLSEELGEDVTIEKLVDLPPISSSKKSPFVLVVYSVCGIDPENVAIRKSLPYMTDGAVFQQLYNEIPTIILGHGQAEMAHQTDEFCYVSKIEEAVEIYKNIIFKNGEL